MVQFEAAVAGGIPIIKALREGLAANQIRSIAGIINGTSNFILTEMREKGSAFADVLKEAQALGYAEADPTFDIEGHDAGHKITIMSALAFGTPMNFSACYLEGISKLDSRDIKYAEELGYRIKLLGITRKTDKGIELRVHPTLIPESRLLANVNGVMNAVRVNADMVGETLYYGAAPVHYRLLLPWLPILLILPACLKRKLTIVFLTWHSNLHKFERKIFCLWMKLPAATICVFKQPTSRVLWVKLPPSWPKKMFLSRL